jgi:hypothetical protein
MIPNRGFRPLLPAAETVHGPKPPLEYMIPNRLVAFCRTT